MTNLEAIVDRWADQVGTDSPKFLRRAGANIIPAGRALYSYGSHFTLARIMPGLDGPRSWFLLNGDRYSVSTARHQSMVRSACQATGLPVMILPFSVLNQAGIEIDSIEPVQVTEDTFEDETHHASSREDIPANHRLYATQTTSGWTWTTRRHWLGASLFRARFDVWARAGRDTGTAYFLSSFDDQETRHYFMCQLSAGVPVSVKDALNMLRPPEVIAADIAGLTVTRQGDVFAVPVTMTTRDVRALGTSRRSATLPGVIDSHTVTELVIASDGVLYARGSLRHRPAGFGRRPEHRRQKMGDGKQWHRVVKNTVPVDSSGLSRAWSQGGNVD